MLIAVRIFSLTVMMPIMLIVLCVNMAAPAVTWFVTTPIVAILDGIKIIRGQ